MGTIAASLEDASLLADNYPDKAEWQRVHYYEGVLTFPEDLNPPISSVDLPAARRRFLMQYARQRRWTIETGGITVGGMAIATDDRSKILIAGSRTSADADPNFTTTWDAGEVGVTLTASQIVAISNAVRDHIKAVFAKFETVRVGIVAGTLDSKSAIDAAFAA